jgi:hypothetical protein
LSKKWKVERQEGDGHMGRPLYRILIDGTVALFGMFLTDAEDWLDEVVDDDDIVDVDGDTPQSGSSFKNRR